MYNDYFVKKVFDIPMSSWLCISLSSLFIGSFAFAQQTSNATIGPAPEPPPLAAPSVPKMVPAPNPIASPTPAPTATPIPSPTPVASPAPVAKATLVVAYFSPLGKTQFESKIKPVFAKQSSPCGGCQIVDYTPYNDKGEFVAEKLESVLKELPDNVKILFFDFNMKRGSFSDAVMAALNQNAANGPLVVASAGAPPPQEASRPLSKTVFGQIGQALIIGDLEERDRLTRNGFFGPEMYMAIRPPKDMQGEKGLGPTLFVAKLASQYSRRQPKDWLAFFKTKKDRNRKIWLELGDLFY